ncbi:MAG TPA: hypothetical protein VGE45_02680 [Chloroflexia bacterium]|jgi:hypothetical protein
MSRTVDQVTIWPLRTLPKDIGVAVVVLVALLGGLLLRWSTEGSTKAYASADNSFSVLYPASWRTTEITDTLLLRVENPQASSAYKTNVAVDVRELDPASPPTLQELIDRRIEQHSGQAGYHFLSSNDRTVSGLKASEIEYAFVAQPIDSPRRATLPVVAHSREYIVVAKDRIYYITLAAPESDFATASELFDRMLETVKVQ